MRLLRFRVTGFRSVDDSGWIDASDVTALIGTNESGKTNLLVPLWKLHPAKDGEIQDTADYPRKRYNEIRTTETKPVFITAEFDVGEPLAARLATLTGAAPEAVRVAEVKRRLDGQYHVAFPRATPLRAVQADEARASIAAALADVERAPTTAKADEPVHKATSAALRRALSTLPDALDAGGDGQAPATPTDDDGTADASAAAQSELDAADIAELLDVLRAVDPETASKRSAAKPAYATVLEQLEALHARVSVPHPHENAEARTLVMQHLPRFVYYSNYGNLDSEIYLPHVIDNLERTDLGSREAAKARTLKVLFEFVRLKPQEIRELGRDFQRTQYQAKPTDDEIAEIAEKKQRSILLQSAGTELTEKFRAWWKQGEYRFRFEADGDHFRIWVSDDKRPEEIELEGRSTGLQ